MPAIPSVEPIWEIGSYPRIPSRARQDDFPLFRSPGCVAQGLQDVFSFEVRIVSQNLVDSMAATIMPTIMPTVTLMPRTHARPPMTSGCWLMRSSCSIALPPMCLGYRTWPTVGKNQTGSGSSSYPEEPRPEILYHGKARVCIEPVPGWLRRPSWNSARLSPRSFVTSSSRCVA